MLIDICDLGLNVWAGWRLVIWGIHGWRIFID